MIGFDAASCSTFELTLPFSNAAEHVWEEHEFALRSGGCSQYVKMVGGIVTRRGECN